MKKCNLVLSIVFLVVDFIPTSSSLPISNTNHLESQLRQKPVADSMNMISKRTYGGELDFPDNYDYQFSDMGDFFDDYTDPHDPQSPHKRYSDAMATDMLSRLERMRLMKARNKFLQMIMGKRSGNSLTDLVEMLHQKQRDENSQVSDALENLKMVGLYPREGEQEGAVRIRRHAEGTYTDRTSVLARLRAEAVKREFENDVIGQYFDRKLRTPEFIKALMLAES
ncbi:uncharacterized protein LOC120331762 isoform X1 [Styela clava]